MSDPIHQRVFSAGESYAHCGVAITDPLTELSDHPPLVTCPQCHVHLQIDHGQPGREVFLPKCGAAIEDSPSQMSGAIGYVTCGRCLAGTFSDPRSRESEDCAWRAELAENRGERDEAKRLYAEAAELEELVVADVPAETPRVQHVLAISAVALWLKATNHERASSLAAKYLAAGILTEEDLGDMVDLQIAEMLRQDQKDAP